MAVKPTRDSCRLHHTPAEIFSQVSLDHEAQDLRMSSLPHHRAFWGNLLPTSHKCGKGAGGGVLQGSLLKEQVTELQAPSEAALGTLPACKYSFAACRQMGHDKCGRHRSHTQAQGLVLSSRDSRLVPSCSPEDQVSSFTLPVLRHSGALTVKVRKTQVPPSPGPGT